MSVGEDVIGSSSASLWAGTAAISIPTGLRAAATEETE